MLHSKILVLITLYHNNDSERLLPDREIRIKVKGSNRARRQSRLHYVIAYICSRNSSSSTQKMSWYWHVTRWQMLRQQVFVKNRVYRTKSGRGAVSEIARVESRTGRGLRRSPRTHQHRLMQCQQLIVFVRDIEQNATLIENTMGC